MYKRSVSAGFLLAMLCVSGAAPTEAAQLGAAATETGARGGGGYEDLVVLFEQFREFREPAVNDGVPDYTASAMERQYAELGEYQRRLAAFDISEWPISQQVDYHLVRAEMNGLEFYHRVMKPWSTSPDFYWGSPNSSSMPFYGVAALPEVPLGEEEVEAYRLKLRALPRILAQAKDNIVVAEGKRDAALLGIRSMEKGSLLLRESVALVQEHHPEMVADVDAASAAVESYKAWIEENLDAMTAPTGVGVENYDWWLKNVWLLPYTWDDVRTTARREYARVVASLKLEEYRNRNLPPLEPAESEAEWSRQWSEAERYLFRFVREGEFLTFPDNLTAPVLELPVPLWLTESATQGEPLDLFDHMIWRNPLQRAIHYGATGHALDRVRPQPHLSPIRATQRLYEMTYPRNEGLGYGLEEALMHAGILDDRPRAREVVYIVAAYRASRALADLSFHANELDYVESVRFGAEMTPYGWAARDSYFLWDHAGARDTMWAPGVEAAYSLGKAQFDKLLADRAHQLGDSFRMGAFMDEFLDAGLMPFSLIRWEMTGLTDEMERLW